MSDNYPVDKAIERLEKQVSRLTAELLNTKFQHAELAATVDRWNVYWANVAALESPAAAAPAPDPVCLCGHAQSDHVYRGTDACDRLGCSCEVFVPTEHPPLDPVLVEFVAKWIADHAESSVCNWDDCVEENQRDYRSYAESAIAAIRAYRKDGAR